jgi:hypothetical protein
MQKRAHFVWRNLFIDQTTADQDTVSISFHKHTVGLVQEAQYL